MSDETVVSSESEEREPGSTRAEARDLGDVTGQTNGSPDMVWLRETVGGDGDAVDYYRFELSESRGFLLMLDRHESAVVSLEDASGAVLSRSMQYVNFRFALVVRELEPGTYYVRVAPVGEAASGYQLGYVALPLEDALLPQYLRWLGAPSFAHQGYGFSLLEGRDGVTERVWLGTVGATDPAGETLHFSIVGGNESGLFAIDGETGSLYYVGTGEDYEGGDGPYELRVRVGDGTHTLGTTVVVRVSDVAESPVFGEASYTFVLSENADGSTDRVSLGTVSATDPDEDTVSYAIAVGNESGLFEIDAASGELFYVGSGEDYEGGDGPYALTVRVGDGTHTVDAIVTVTVGDEPEAPSFGEASYAFVLSENVDGRTARVSLGTVSATDPDEDTVSYAIAVGNESGLFEIDASSGELFYVGSGEDYEGDDGPYELTVRAAAGTHTVDAVVTVTVSDEPEAPAFGETSYAFALVENVDGRIDRVSLGVVSATDPDEDTVSYAIAVGNESGLFEIDAASGELFYVGSGEDYEGGDGPYELTVRAAAGTHTVDAAVTVTVGDEPEAPSFGEASYAFVLAENVDGSTARVSLGAVSATDPDGDAVRYELVGGNESGRFDLDAQTGALYYVGSGEDYEGGDGSYALTVRAAAGTHTVDAAVTVTVGDVAESPAFVEASYAFELAENTDGSTNRVSLGVVSATDPDGDAVRYELMGGDESGRFELDPASGELFYVGSGEDHEGGDGPYELTVRAAAGTQTVDATVTVTVGDVAESPSFGEASYAFELAEHVDGSTERVALGTVTATDPDGDTVRYELVRGSEGGLFHVDPSSGELFYVGSGEDHEGGDGPYALTVRASDGTHTVDAAVTVTVSNEAEAPEFGETSYAFVLPEHLVS